MASRERDPYLSNVRIALQCTQRCKVVVVQAACILSPTTPFCLYHPIRINMMSFSSNNLLTIICCDTHLATTEAIQIPSILQPPLAYPAVHSTRQVCCEWSWTLPCKCFGSPKKKKIQKCLVYISGITRLIVTLSEAFQRFDFVC